MKWTYGLFDQNYRVAMFSTFYTTVSGIIKPSLKSIRHYMPFGQNTPSTLYLNESEIIIHSLKSIGQL